MKTNFVSMFAAMFAAMTTTISFPSSSWLIAALALTGVCFSPLLQAQDTRFGGDSAPNNWFIKEAKGAEVVVHECIYTVEGLTKALDIAPYQAAFRSKVDADSKISEFLAKERSKGFTPRPLPERGQSVLNLRGSGFPGPATLSA